MEKRNRKPITSIRTGTKMTWEEIIRIDHRLGMMYEMAKGMKRHEGFCANKVWYTIYKPRLVQLVGWSAAKEELRNSEAYDIAYRKIYDALPDCNHEEETC